MIKSLTVEQEKSIKTHTEMGLAAGLKTIKSMGELDYLEIEKSIRFFYNYCLQATSDKLNFIYAKGPTEAGRILAEKATHKINSTNYPIYNSQEDIYWTYLYKFFITNFKDTFDNEFLQKTFAEDWVGFLSNIHQIIVGNDTCIVVAHPMYYRRDMQNRLHSLDSPVCEYLDGTKYYAIDGLLLPSFIIETPLEKVTKEMILSIENVDFRRCMIKRLGAKKTIEILGAKVIDVKTLGKGGIYELLSIGLDLGEGENNFPYLKMINPSTGEIHIEGVAVGATTVEQALAYRNGIKTYIMPEHLS